MTDEERFWALKPQCAEKGISDGRLGRLQKIIATGELTFAEGVKLIRASLKARDPSTYFGKAVSERERKAGLRSAVKPSRAKSGDLPSFLQEFRNEGYAVQPDGEGRWKVGSQIFDSSGDLIGW